MGCVCADVGVDKEGNDQAADKVENAQARGFTTQSRGAGRTR